MRQGNTRLSRLVMRGKGRNRRGVVEPVPEMDLDWLKRLDIHLRAYEQSGSVMPLVSLREEIDCALFVCGMGDDPRLAVPCPCDAVGGDADCPVCNP